MSEKNDNPAPWHSYSQEEVLQQGLLLRLLRQFHNILIYVLLGSAGITALLNHWMDTLVILAVAIANAIWDGVLVFMIGAVVFAICEIEKQLRLLLGKRRKSLSGRAGQ